ncbi:MAG: hypothetical protein IPO91_02820 [Chloroflexi bacterium]|nr:hypothetical protein [Chloroflexota bacterium]
MAVRVLVFDPMNISSIEEFEQQLDTYLAEGWEILQALSGNRAGVAEGVRTFRNSSRVSSPEHKDYVVFVLRNAVMDQAAHRLPEDQLSTAHP